MQELFKRDDKLKAGLYIVSTPIGNYQDITLRAITVLNSCDMIFCEDTRVINKLLEFLQISKKPLYVYNEHSTEKDRKKIIDFIKNKKSIALVSDAGTPLISDPGYQLMKKCHEETIAFFPIPGVSSVITALSVSGLPTDKFSFFGFLPPKSSARQKKLKELQDKKETIIFFETAKRLKQTLQDCLDILGDRNICIARELTKMYEEIKKDKISDLLNYYKNSIIKGEIVLLIEGQTKEMRKKFEINFIKKELESTMKKMKLKDAVDLIASANNLNKKKIYQLALEIKK
jgi:16S rRNA (cytidine1402-2'-O)-methyltransferase